MYFAKDVINNIDAALKEAGISKAQMCRDLGINRNTINAMTDKRGMSSFDLARIADYLHVTVDSLLGRNTDEMTSAPIETDRSELTDALSKLPREDRDELANLAKLLLSKQQSPPEQADQ